MINQFLLPEIADSYDHYYSTDEGAKIDSIEKELISKLLKEVTGSQMLELGCGTGHWTGFFLEKGFSVIGIDTSEAMLTHAKSKNLKAEFRLGNAEELPFEDNSFEVISGITMFEFVDNQEKLIQEITRCLKPGGHLIMGNLNAKSVIGETKEQNPTFKNAQFHTKESLWEIFSKIGKVKMESGVYLDQFFTLTAEENASNIEPVFIASLVQKI